MPFHYFAVGVLPEGQLFSTGSLTTISCILAGGDEYRLPAEPSTQDGNHDGSTHA